MEQILSNKTDLLLPSHTERRSNSNIELFAYFHHSAKTREENFQSRFPNLETYLNQVLEDQNYKFSTGSEEEEKISIAKAKAREYFKNCACEIFRGVKGKFEEQQYHHIMPEIFLNSMMDSLKLSISLSLNKLTDRIIKSASRSNSPIKKTTVSIQKKSKKGKNKIPKRALGTLKTWLSDHYQDPYPSSIEKIKIAEEAGISVKQVQNWFTNIRGRVWKRSNAQEKFSMMIQDKLVEDQQRTNLNIGLDIEGLKRDGNNVMI
jgi:hypothetical protein